MNVAPNFVRVYETEIAELAKESPMIGVLLAVRFLTRGGWATRRRDVAKVAGLSVTPRRLNQLLAELEQRGFFRREFCGSAHDPWGRFKLAEVGSRASNLLGSPASNLEPEISHYTSQDPDPDLIPPSMTESSRARARETEAEMEGGMEGDDELVLEARKLWPNVARRVAAKNIARLRELAGDVASDELAAYLRYCSEDPTLAKATLPLAAACTTDRLEPWLTRRARAQRRRAPRNEAAAAAGERILSPAENAERAKQAMLSLRRPTR